MKESVLSGLGHIDVLDFSLSSALKSINEACYTMHEGKTWSHVEILLTQKLKSSKAANSLKLKRINKFITLSKIKDLDLHIGLN